MTQFAPITVRNLRTTMRIFRNNPCATNAHAYRVAAMACVSKGGCEQFPTGFPHGMSYISVCEETADVMIAWLAETDTAVVTLTIDANKLATMLNATIASTVLGYDNETTKITEACRDALMRARQAATATATATKNEE